MLFMKAKMWLRLSLLFILINVLKVSAQDNLSLQEAIRIGIESNYDIKLVKNDLEIAKANNTKGNAGMLPNVNGVITNTTSNNNLKQKFASGDEINKNGVWGNNLVAGIQASWTVFDGFRMFATKHRLESIETLGELNFRNQVQQTAANIAAAYYTIVLQQNQLKTIDNLIVTIQERMNLSEQKFKAGSASKMDYLQAQLDLNAQKSNRIRQLQNIKNAKTALNQLLYRDANTDFGVSDSLSLAKSMEMDEITSKITSQNPALMVARQNMAISEWRIKEANALHLPTVGLTGTYNYSLNNSQAGFSLYNQNLGFNLGVGINIPIYQGGNINRLQQVAQLDLVTAKLQADKLGSDLGYMATVAYQNYQMAKSLAEIENSNTKVAEENLNIASERFRLGQSTSYLELREAQRTFEDAQVRKLNAQYEAKISEINILQLTGTLLVE